MGGSVVMPAAVHPQPGGSRGAGLKPPLLRVLLLSFSAGSRQADVQEQRVPRGSLSNSSSLPSFPGQTNHTSAVSRAAWLLSHGHPGSGVAQAAGGGPRDHH